MAKEPDKKSRWDDNDNDKAKSAPAEDLKTEQEKAPVNTQHEPYPTGNPPPARNHLGQPIDESGKVIEEAATKK